ncbi:hypothetical protein IW140_006241 [Coemansia sp. RSA 1813]|nr:hypothetical protein EV178_006228 [Coemansia sp. RSA 1646]KAJ1765640.1 hypothetical protein LPJ74_006272 [Coemansia sp. RSA 1843]KAJ2085727.1 hypothetical protein IW138_006150 [Coemansia sp. RSA 986]KAJ2210495.1 hypothetical protein EV179_006200 [Coemansia sp. RSA 487]KAJ2563060.1 hypothetical protein IW140_006241 [Coemansia sp. RSA 1813]
MVATYTGSVYDRPRRSLGVQEYDLLAIDYVQGTADMNFAFFFDTPEAGAQHPSTKCLHESLVRAIQLFPILTGHIVNSRRGYKSRGKKKTAAADRWTVVVDPSHINWPAISECRLDHVPFAQVKETMYRWDQWPVATKMADLHSMQAQPLFGVHIVRYACGATSIHTKMRHQVMDGNGLFRFYFTWARMCAHIHRGGGGLVRLTVADYPLCDRLICASKIIGSNGLTKQKPKSGKSAVEPCSKIAGCVYQYMAKFEVFLRRLARHRRWHAVRAKSLPPARIHRFAVSQEALHSLKLRFGTLGACSPGNAFIRKHKIGYMTTNDLLLALFWRAVTRAHAIIDPTDPYTCMSIACDIRKRIGLPATYTGNASFPLPIHLTKQMMQTHTIADTAAYIRYHVNLLSPEFARQMGNLLVSEKLMKRFAAMFHPATSFFMASALAGFPMFQSLDFGMGGPAHIDIPPYLAPGFSIWLPTNPQENIFEPQCMLMNISLRDDVFDYVLHDPEFRTFVNVIY